MPDPIVPPPITPTCMIGQTPGACAELAGNRAARRSAWKIWRNALHCGEPRSSTARARSRATPSANGRSSAQPIASPAATGAIAPRARLRITPSAASNAARSTGATSRAEVTGQCPASASAPTLTSAALRRSVAISSSTPSFNASAAATCRPELTISSAAIAPTSRGNRCVPPAPGIIPIRLSGSPTRPSGAMIRA